MRRAFRRYVVEGFLRSERWIRAPKAQILAFLGVLENFWGILDVFERFRAEYRE